MFKVLIVEDTPAEADVLRGFLARYAAEKRLELNVETLGSALEFIEARRAADLVLMDIDMPGINGMEAAQIMRGYDAQTPLIFVTNLAQYAVRGYSVDALDFVAHSDLLFVDMLKHDVCYHLADGRVLRERGTMRATAQRLGEDEFVKVSSGCLVNMGCVTRIGAESVTVADGTELFFSRSQKKAALERLANFVGRSI